MVLLAALLANPDETPLVYPGGTGPGAGKHIVLIAGDDEYRSEELIPHLARILSRHHGFRCTVLFSTNPANGQIDPAAMENIPGLQHLQQADLVVLFLRFRDLPDEQMKHLVDYIQSGRPIVALRTSTHAFNLAKHKSGPYARWTWNVRGEFAGGFGRQVLGETWVNHYGEHEKESTRATIAPGMEKHPLLRGVGEIWGPSDVYGLTTLRGDATPLLLGQPLAGMSRTDPPNGNKKPLPVAWTKTWTPVPGKTARIFTTTMGHAGDFRDENFRRLLVNAAYWSLNLEEQMPPRARVDLVGSYDPPPIHRGKHRAGLKPADWRLPEGGN